MEINYSKLDMLNSYYSGYIDTIGVFVTGKKGVGKTTVVQKFLNDKKNVMHISVIGKNNYMLEPLVMAINRYYMLENSNHIFDFQNGLDIVDKITMEVLNICRKEKMILYFESVVDYGETLLDCIKKILNLLVNHHKEMQAFLILDIDTDAESPIALNKTLESIYSISPTFLFIPFRDLEREELEIYFNEIFCNKIDISDKDLEYIISSCSRNLSRLNIIINYLKQTAVIARGEDGYVCAGITPGSLTDILYESVITRYNLLNDEMKRLLEQSSLIGINFDTKKLHDSFQILRADEELKRIEGISSLIHEEKDYLYCFENFETYNIILDKIDLNEKQNWNYLLAIYYEKQLSSPLHYEKKIYNLFKVAFHYKESLHFDQSIYYYILLIKTEIAVLDCRQAVKFIEEANNIVTYINERARQLVSAVLTMYEAECNKLLGQYNKAAVLYQECISTHKHNHSNVEILDLILSYAYSLYMDGNLPDALNIILEIKDELTVRPSENILLYKALSFLSSIYHLQGNDAQAEEYYIGSVTFCKENGFEEEYYIQLKKASMIFDTETAQPLVREAADYFERHHKISHLAETLHNLSTDSLYLLQLESFETDCQKSIDLFQQYGSLLVHYPLNTLGIYTAVIKQNIDEAIELFESILQFDVEPFSKVSAYTNLATCYRYKMDYANCLRQIQAADNLIEQARNEDIILLQTYHYINNALYYKAQGNLRKSLFIFQQCLNQLDVQTRHKFYICNCMKKIFLELNMDIPTFIESCCNIVTYPLISSYLEKDMFFATMRFYE